MRSSSFSRNHPYAKTRGWVSPKRAASSLPTITDGVNEVDDASEIWVLGGTVSEPEEGVAQISFGGQAIGSNSAGGTGGGGSNAAALPVRMFNSSGLTLIPGDVVVTDPNVDSGVTTTATASNTRIAGVVQAPIEIAQWGPVLFNGFAPIVNTTGTVTRGNYALTSATAKLAGATAARVAGSFAVYLTGTDLPDFVTDSRTTEQVVPVAELEITMPPNIPAGRVLFLALWVGTGASSIDVDDWTLIGAESGFTYYYRISAGDDTATATWTTASVAVATVLVLHESVLLAGPIAAHDYDTSTSAAAVSSLDVNIPKYAIAGVRADTTPGSGFVRLGGGSVDATGGAVALFNGSDGGATSGIGAASFDGSEWDYSTTPVLSPGASGNWDDTVVGRPCLIHDGTQYVMYYDGYNGSSFRIGRATAPSPSGPWTKYASNPVLGLGSGGAFDDSHVSFPTVLYEPSDTGKEWKMWYEGDPTSSWGSGCSIGYAYSSDGLSWTKVGAVIGPGSAGTWRDEGVAPGAIYKDGATYNLFIGGRQGTTNPRWQGGRYTFSDPEGVYTADAGNPIILARFNDAGSRQDVQITGGSAVATGLSDTSKLNVGEPVTLHSSLVETEIHTIAAINSATQVTLDAPASSSFNSPTGGAGIGSLAFNSVFPRSVGAAGGGYEAYIAVFQPVEDLGVGGSKLREASMRMTAPALTGPWSYDYTTGMLFPINLPGSMFSSDAENPSVIISSGSAAGTLAGKYIGLSATATSPFTGGGAQNDAIFAVALVSAAKASALLYGPDLGGSSAPAAQTGGSAPVAAPTTSEIYLHGTDLYVWDGSAWHGPYLISDSGS